MSQYFITGTSSGIGLEMAKVLLENDANQVTGISRKSVIKHERYKHIYLDLSSIPDVEAVEFSIADSISPIVLVNNAGWIGDVAPLGSAGQSHAAINKSYLVNLVAPTILINQFVSQVKALKTRRVILNISSGAGKYPIKAWSTYCASKAGLDMVTRVLCEEHPEIESYALSPGVIDTAMQEQIRKADAAYFPDLDRFVGYYKKGELRSAKDVATQIVSLIEQPTLIPDNLFSLRDL